MTEPQRPSVQRPRAVVLDDDPVDRNEVVTALVSGGYDAIGLPGDEAGVAACMAMGFDALVADMRLAHVDLLSLVAQLRLTRKPAPVVVLHTRTRQLGSDHPRMVAFGDVPFVRKSAGHGDLLALMATLLPPGRVMGARQQ